MTGLCLGSQEARGVAGVTALDAAASLITHCTLLVRNLGYQERSRYVSRPDRKYRIDSG